MPFVWQENNSNDAISFSLHIGHICCDQSAASCLCQSIIKSERMILIVTIVPRMCASVRTQTRQFNNIIIKIFYYEIIVFTVIASGKFLFHIPYSTGKCAQGNTCTSNVNAKLVTRKKAKFPTWLSLQCTIPLNTPTENDGNNKIYKVIQ